MPPNQSSTTEAAAEADLEPTLGPDGWVEGVGPPSEDDERLIEAIDGLHRRIGSLQREMLRRIADADRTEAWRGWGTRDLAHFLSIRYGISWWRADRWARAARALEALPRTSEALASGELSLDKCVELCRFATAATEAELLRWAHGVSGAAIRHRADRETRSLEQVREATRDRRVQWWWPEDRFALSAELPAAEGLLVARCLAREAGRIPAMPGEEGPRGVDARRADALVALCSARLGEDARPHRATVVVHASARALGTGSGGAELEDGPAIHPQVARRLACDARVQEVLEDPVGLPVRLGRTRRVPPAWMERQLRYRDRECRFPGCGARRFLQSHHAPPWTEGGRTDVDHLILTCFWHHRLMHELGWRVRLERDGTARWFRPDGKPYRPGPAPPRAPGPRGPGPPGPGSPRGP